MSNSFNTIAPCYDSLAFLVFGNRIKLAPLYFLPRLKEPSKILVIGGGTGAILKALRRHFPHTPITFLEPSEQMMVRARKRSVSNVTFVSQTLADFNTAHQFDLILTPFVLDVFNESELPPAIEKVKAMLNPGGHWLHSDFYQGENLWWQRWLIRSMYKFFKVFAGLKQQKLLDFDHYFSATHDLNLVASQSWLRGLIKSVWLQKEQPL